MTTIHLGKYCNIIFIHISKSFVHPFCHLVHSITYCHIAVLCAVSNRTILFRTWLWIGGLNEIWVPNIWLAMKFKQVWTMWPCLSLGPILLKLFPCTMQIPCKVCLAPTQAHIYWFLQYFAHGSKLYSRGMYNIMCSDGLQINPTNTNLSLNFNFE